MNLLMVGSGRGSFQIRCVQLGAALGARVTSLPTGADWEWADLVVLHKKWAPRFAAAAHHAHVPVVWDAIDCWQQPAENGLSETAARAMFQQQIDTIQPVLVIGSTQAQAEAAGGTYLPHHSWPGLEPTPARPTVKVVGYEGNPAYLGRWMGAVTDACTVRGWVFLINPLHLSDVDVFVAFRDGPWDGWMCRQWKSGVKLVNALAAGRPVVTQDSAAVQELPTLCALAEDPDDLDSVFDMVSMTSTRDHVVEHSRVCAPAYRLEAVAARYSTILADVRVSCLT